MMPPIALARLATLILVAVPTYFVLLFASLWLSGDGVSCTSECSWLNDAYPWPMVAGIVTSLLFGWAVALRLGRRD